MNELDCDIEITIYGNSTDTTLVLSPKENSSIHHFTPLGRARRISDQKVYFYDSLTITRLDSNTKSPKDYSDINEWIFETTDDYEGSYTLLIDEDDF